MRGFFLSFPWRIKMSSGKREGRKEGGIRKWRGWRQRGKTLVKAEEKS